MEEEDEEDGADEATVDDREDMKLAGLPLVPE